MHLEVFLHRCQARTNYQDTTAKEEAVAWSCQEPGKGWLHVDLFFTHNLLSDSHVSLCVHLHFFQS